MYILRVCGAKSLCTGAETGRAPLKRRSGEMGGGRLEDDDDRELVATSTCRLVYCC